MKQRFLHKALLSFIIFTLVFAQAPRRALAQPPAAAPNLCDVLFASFSARSSEVVEIKCTNSLVDAQGNINVDLALEAKSYLTYGFLFSVESGEVSGPALDILLRAETVSIPLVGKSTLDIGRVTFSPGAQLRLRLDKIELVPGDAGLLLGLDFVTAFLLFTLGQPIPTSYAEQLPSIGELFVELLNNVGFDTALFAYQLQRDDYLGAMRTLAWTIAQEPTLFADFLFSEYGLSVSATALRDFGIFLGRTLPVIAVIPLVHDLFARPRSVQIDIRNGEPAGTPTDVFLIVDLSGSFYDDLPLFQSQAADIIANMKASNPDTRFGLAKFEDYPIWPFGIAAAGDKAHERLVDLTHDSDAVLNAIYGLFTRNGYDIPESQLTALYQAATGAGQDLSGQGYPEASIPAGQQASFRSEAAKLIILWTDASFHQPGDPGDIPYPGPSFDETLNALKGIPVFTPGPASEGAGSAIQSSSAPKVIGISSGDGGVADLEQIAAATQAFVPAGGVDCDGDAVIDLGVGEPLVCTVSFSGTGIEQAIPALVESATTPGQADLEIIQSPVPPSLTPGAELTYTLTVFNHGPETSTGEIVYSVLPSQVTFQWAVATQGDCSHDGGVVICQLGYLGNGMTTSITINGVVNQGGTITNTAFIAGIETDPNESNNLASASSIANTFSDVPTSYWSWDFIERLYAGGITGGCAVGPIRYCPENTVTRAQMAVFLERGIHGASFVPPAVGASTGFGDVPPSYWSASFIKQLVTDSITVGCGSGNYCPEQPVTRAQMAVFLLRSKHGGSYVPPGVGAGTGFGDVPANYWSAAWIKQLVTEGITSGCGGGNYCPEQPVTRAQMAVFLVRTFNLP